MTLAPERILPVVVIERADDASALGEALVRGGISSVEVTLRTDAALDAIRAMRTVSGLTVGAGTVRSVEDASNAAAAGAQFLVSPGLDLDVVDRARSLSVPIVPGVATASEIQTATRHGIRTLKLFPVGPLGGADYVAALAGPFPDVRFLPSGGITVTSAPAYLALRCVDAVCGSWMVDRQLLRAQDWEAVSERSRVAVMAASA